MEKYNQKQQHPGDSDANKKSTNSGGNDDTPSTSSSKPKDIFHDDVCSICFDDVSIMNINYFQCTQCGKVMHLKCFKRLLGTKSLSVETRNSCPMCRAPGVAEGSKEMVERLQKWSQLGKPWAQYSLGVLYSKGLGVNKDPKRAGELWKLAADHGHHNAQFNLGLMYFSGEGVIQSDTLSCKYFQLSAIQGHTEAQYKVGFFNEYGKGVEQSDTKAFEYYKLAADQDHCLAQSKVGYYYASGRSGTQSNTDAREWWYKSAKQGNEDAIQNLKHLDWMEGIKTTTSSSNFTDNSSVLCSKCKKPAQTNRTLRNCKCKGAQYCNNTCYHAHWKEHKPEHNRLVKLLPSTGETKEEPTEDK